MASEKNGKSVDVYVLPMDAPKKLAETASFWHVNKEMLRFKLHFFLYFGGNAAAIPFIVVFAKERLGLAPSSLGAVLTAQMFLFIFTKPTIGYVADYFNKLKAIICSLTFVTGLCYFLLLAIPKYGKEDTAHSPPLLSIGIELNTTELTRNCEKFLETTRSSIGVSVTEYSTLNSSQVQLQDKICPLCSVTNLQNTCDERLCISERTEDNEIRRKEMVSRYKQKRVPCFITIDSFIQELCTCNQRTTCRFFMNCTGHLIHASEFRSNASTVEVKRCSSSMCIVLSSVYDFQKISSNYSSDVVDVPRHKISDYKTVQFWVFALLFTMSSVCANAIFTLSDTACCESVQRTGADFGKQRLWGSVGWGSIAPLAGFMNDSTKDFLASWILMAVMLLLFLLNISKLDLVKPHFSKNILRDVGTVFRSKEFLAFEAVIFMNGVGTGMIWFYLIWFLTSIGGSELLCGLTLTVQCFCGALPFMFFSEWILRKFGHFQVLNAGLLVYVVRFLWYSYLHNPWLVLPFECLHGISYGLYYTALASYGKLSSMPGTEATTQSILFSTHEGLGAGIGCVLAGIGFDYVGGHQTFFFASIFCGCGCVVSLVLNFIFRRQKRQFQIPTTLQPQL